MLAELVDAVVGVDTHRDTHQVEIALPTGAPIATTTITNDTAGYTRLADWITVHTPHPTGLTGPTCRARVVVAVEGTRSYGAGVTRALTAAGLTVIEAEQPSGKTRRGRGKSDPIDAHLAVKYALELPADRLPTPRADGDREALRILLGARHDLTTTCTAQINALRALLRDGDDTDSRLAAATLTDAVLTGLARRRVPPHATRAQAVRHGEIRRLALAIRQARRALTDNHTALATIVEDLAPGLTDRPGLGPVTAAQIVVSFSHPGRVHSEAAFAALAGTSPLPASSGHIVRHRLNRGGDRRLNRAIHTIALTRAAHDPRTRAYITRRRAQGKTPREIRRCIKRFITRELYRTLNTIMIDN